MESWDLLHPFNAVELAELSGPPEPDRLREVAALTLVEAGACAGRAEAEAAVEPVEVPAADADPASSVAALLDRPMASLRPRLRLAVREADGRRSHTVALAWHHALADGRTAAAVLHAVLARYAGNAEPGAAPFDLGRPVSLRASVAARALSPRFLSGVLGRTANLVRMRRAFRPPAPESGSPRTRVHLPPADAGLLPRLAARARSAGATVNDVLLAAFAGALADAFPRRRDEIRRRDLAISCVADLRRLSPDLEERAGLLLGTFELLLPARLLDDSEAGDAGLLALVVRRTRREKAPSRLAASQATLSVAAAVCRLLGPAEGARYLRRQVVLSGAVTNLKLPRAWYQGPLGERLLDHRLVPSVGPLSPIVLAATTARGRLGLALVSRSDSLSDDDARLVARRLAERLGPAAGPDLAPGTAPAVPSPPRTEAE